MPKNSPLVSPKDVLHAYIGDEQVGVAAPLSEASPSSNAPLYFLTISSNITGTLRFTTTDGQELFIAPSSLQGGVGDRLTYVPDAHYGTLNDPVLLVPGDEQQPYKVIEDDRVVIIRDGVRYNVQGVIIK